MAADSAYDKETVYKAIEAHSPGRRTRVVIPPQRNATLSQNSNTAMRERDRHIRAIERHGRREWYKLSGFTKRSMVENTVYRYKAIIGSEMRARTLARQRVEHRIGCEILNKMAALGIPIRTAPGDSARYVLRRVTQLPASGRSAICSGPCNNAGFRSKILDAYVSRTEKLDELIARMYVHGMSTRDIEATFADVLSGTGVSKSVVSRVTQCLSDDFEVFRKRDLSSEELLYLELDGTFLRYHQGAEKKEPILVATGYRIDGTRVLLHIGVGNGESYANWKGFLQEMVARGLREPLLIVTDGNPGVLKAIEEVFPQSLKQRCQKHRLENILGKAPKEIHDELKAEILESFHAKSYEQGLKKGREVITRYRQRFPSAMNGMEETLEACLQVLRLPEAHHKRLRTSNLLERTFGELKRRTKVIPHFFTEQAAIKLSFAVLLATASKWRGVRMDVFTIRRIEELRNEFLPKSTSEEPAA